MNVTLTIGTTSLASNLSTYKVTKETAYQTLVTTMGGVEHPAGVQSRDIITFSLLPADTASYASIYSVLAPRILNVTYTNPYTNTSTTKQMRVDTDLEQVFGLKSTDGKNYYKGEEIVLRALRCD